MLAWIAAALAIGGGVLMPVAQRLDATAIWAGRAILPPAIGRQNHPRTVGNAEIGRQDADDLRRPAVEHHTAANDGGIAA